MGKRNKTPRELTEQFNINRHREFLAEQAARDGRAPPVVKPPFTIIDGEKAYDAPGQRPLSARDKLRRANIGTAKDLPSDGFVMTDAERGGLSPAAFERLRPVLRLELFNKAKRARELAAR